MAMKTCSNCGAQAGPRKAICDCGTAFPLKNKDDTQTNTTPKTTTINPFAVQVKNINPFANIAAPAKATGFLSQPEKPKTTNSGFLSQPTPTTPVPSKIPLQIQTQPPIKPSGAGFLSQPLIPESKSSESKTELSGGRGKKQCPNCKTFNGIRKQKCDCGYVFQEKLVEDDDSDSEFASKNVNKRNCLLCNTEYDSEDFRIDEYNKIYYYYKYGRYCSVNCLENSDQIKTDIIVDIFEYMKQFTPNAKAKLMEILKKDTKINNVLKGIELDQKDAEEHQNYINERPKINILSPQRKKLTTPKDFKDEGIALPPLRDRKIVEEPVKNTGSFLDIIDD